MSDSNTAQAIAATARSNRDLTRHRFFFGYLYGAFTGTSLYRFWQKWLLIFRRFRAVVITLRVLSFLFVLLQTGTLIILSTLLFLIVLPILLVLMLGILITAAIESRRSNRYLKKVLANRRVCILFQSSIESPFFLQHAKKLVADGFAVIVLSPYLISSRGIDAREQKAPFYCTLRCEAPHLYLVRRYYFFSLRKHVLRNLEIAYLF